MPRYIDLNREFQQACRSKSVEEFIESLKAETTSSSYVGSLFLARAYDFIGDDEEAARYYATTLRLANPEDRNTSRMVQEVYQFTDRSERTELLDLIAQRRLPGAKPQSEPRDWGKHADLDLEEAAAIGRRAFTNGEVENALEYLEDAYEGGLRNARVIYVLAQTLQRLRRYREAISYLDQAIDTPQSREDRASLLNLKAQIHSSQREWPDAAQAYEKVLELQSGKRGRGGQRRFTFIQLANIYRKAGQLDDAGRVVDRLLEEFPEDQQALRIKAALQLSEQRTIEPEVDDAAVEVELPHERIDPVSPMLQRDIEVSSYRDEIILRQGEPTTGDADRLLGEAESKRDADFVERFPLFLEAAKAYSDLPEFSYDLGNFYRALARYAMLKGGALVSQFDREITTIPRQLVELRRLRDSASSYYLEALLLQANVGADYLLIALQNHLYVQIAYRYAAQGFDVPDDLTASRRNFASILAFAMRSGDSSIHRILCESIGSWGASTGRTWNEVAKVRGSVGGLFYEQKNREMLYRIFSTLTGIEFGIDEKPGRVLSEVFRQRRSQIQGAHNYFLRFQSISFEIDAFVRIRDLWEENQHYHDVLLDTDIDTVSRISRVLSTLAPYQTRSTDERTSILVSSRNEIDRILEFIEENTTYWGRVSFEPTLLRWQSAIRNIETRRSSEVQPVLRVSLEPEIFSIKDDKVFGSLNIQNSGRGTAEKCVVSFEVTDHTHEPLLADRIDIHQEIRSGGQYFHRISFPKTCLPHGIDQSYLLRVKASPFYRGVELHAKWSEHTLEVDTEIRFELEDIVWDELRIPENPKMFVGRDHEFIRMLDRHLKSRDRARTYILVGLTRTGKSSILTYLSRRIDLDMLKVGEVDYQLVCFMWDLAKASAETNAGDMWAYLLRRQIMGKLEELVSDGKLASDTIPPKRSGHRFRLKDWDLIIDHLHQHKVFPVLLIDEFSHYKNLVDKQRIDNSFLAKIRSDALEDRSAFVFAGTYDLRKLIQDPTYGITGQLVNATQKAVTGVSEGAAIELMEAMGDKLVFTPDAKELLLHLSGRMPYFIQLLCNRCAKYAYHSGRHYMGPAEVDHVVSILTAEAEDHDPNLDPLDGGIFMNNMLMVGDPPDFEVALTTICDIVRGEQNPRYITYSELMAAWRDGGVPFFQRRLSSALKELTEREVLLQRDDEGQPSYKLSIDLFRRWWAQENPYLRLALDTLREDN